MFDFLIKNASVLDGSGAPAFAGNMAIADGRIAAVGNVTGDAGRVIDASGRVAAPGFIDIHSHTDAGLLVDPRAQSKVTQGITLELCGQCGFSPGPTLDEGGLAELASWRTRHGIEEKWRMLGEFLSILESRRIAVNFATLVGHSNLRAAVVGHADRAPSPEEIDRMKSLAAEAMKEGAFGLSSGLIYAPGCFAGTDEIAEVASAVAPYGGIYDSHIRSESKEMVSAVAEAIEIGRRGGVAVQIAHHKGGEDGLNLVDTTLGMVRDAQLEGLDVTVDQYPYIASATSLSVFLPKWAHDGGDEAMMERIANQRPLLLEALREIGGLNAEERVWSTVLISSVRSDANRDCEGMNLVEIARERGAPCEETVLDLLAEEKLSVSMVHFSQCEEAVVTIMRSDLGMFGTDASARAVDGELSKGKPHPRAYGTFPRILGRYVREQKVIPLETAIRKMTSVPARKLGLIDRGALKPGNWADVVVFDPETVIDTATYREPHQISKGIDYVFVNGRLTVERQEMTGVLAGRVLRKRIVRDPSF